MLFERSSDLFVSFMVGAVQIIEHIAWELHIDNPSLPLYTETHLPIEIPTDWASDYVWSPACVSDAWPLLPVAGHEYNACLFERFAHRPRSQYVCAWVASFKSFDYANVKAGRFGKL